MTTRKRTKPILRKPTLTLGGLSSPIRNDEEDEDDYGYPQNPKFDYEEFILLKESEEEVFRAAKRVFGSRY